MIILLLATIISFGGIGFTSKVEASNNKVAVVVEMNPKKMSTDDYESYSMGENYDSMKAKLTDEGYTCK